VESVEFTHSTDCTVIPDDVGDLGNTVAGDSLILSNLHVGASVVVPAMTFSITCNEAGPHLFGFTSNITPLTGILDPNVTNNAKLDVLSVPIGVVPS
jgi:hypothetical protein